MYVKTEQAFEMYDKACQARETGNAILAEVYYLKSWSLFEQAGGRNYLHAANALNGLALLRQSRGDLGGALRSARQSIRIMQAFGAQDASLEAESVRTTAWELVRNLAGHPEPA